MLSRILLAGLVASTLAFAQRVGAGRGGSNMSGGVGETRMDRLSSALKLSKDQRKEIKAALDDAQKQATPVYQQLPKSHLAVLEAQIASIELHAFASTAGLETGATICG